MQQYKLFLIKLCELENITKKDIMEITGKSQSVVYNWMNLSEPDFPPFESLIKILYRLGMSLDDFIKDRHPVYLLPGYDNEKSVRSYYNYIYGTYEHSYIDIDILDSSNAEEAIQTYLFDRMYLNNMVNDHVNGVKIDMQRFESLCRAIKPYVVTEIVDEGEWTVYNLNAQTLRKYKWGADYIKEMQADREEGGLDFDMPHHKIYFPDANYVILLAAQKNIDLLRDYLQIANESEKHILLPCYMKICAQISNYDKKNKILKKLIENNCEFVETTDKTVAEKYHELLKRVLKI